MPSPSPPKLRHILAKLCSPWLQPVAHTVSSKGRSPHLQETSELQLITRMGPTTKNRAHQDTVPLYHIVSSSLDDAVGRGSQGSPVRDAQHTTHEMTPLLADPAAKQ